MKALIATLLLSLAVAYGQEEQVTYQPGKVWIEKGEVFNLYDSDGENKRSQAVAS